MYDDKETRCDYCGAVATTEIQSGWNPETNSGCYTPLCDACYSETPEAEFHTIEYYRVKAAKELGMSHFKPYSEQEDPVGELAERMRAADGK